jgi:hypothetical protein
VSIHKLQCSSTSYSVHHQLQYSVNPPAIDCPSPSHGVHPSYGVHPSAIEGTPSPPATECPSISYRVSTPKLLGVLCHCVLSPATQCSMSVPQSQCLHTTAMYAQSSSSYLCQASSYPLSSLQLITVQPPATMCQTCGFLKGIVQRILRGFNAKLI